MKILPSNTCLWSAIYAAAICLSLSGGILKAQDREAPDTPDTPDTEEKKKDWDSPDVVHPAQLDAASRTLNNYDATLGPAVVPFEGEAPSPLRGGSRDLQDFPGKTVFNPEKILGMDSRSSDSDGGRPVGMIYQLSDGQLKFVMYPKGALDAASRNDPDDPDKPELVDPPVMVGGSYRTPLGQPSRGPEDEKDDDFSWPEDATGSYRTPLGHGSRDEDKPHRGNSGAGGGGVRGSTPETVDFDDLDGGFGQTDPFVPVDVVPDDFSKLSGNSREFEDPKAISPYVESENNDDGPAKLMAGERAIAYQVSHIRNLTKSTVNFKGRWGTGKWVSLSIQPGRDRTTWHLPKNGLKKLTVRFDSDPGPGNNPVQYVLKTYRSPTTVFNKAPTELFVIMPDGRIDLRRNRP